MRWWPTVAVGLLALALLPSAAAAGCTAQQPCRIELAVGDATLSMSPDRVDLPGPYVLVALSSSGEAQQVYLEGDLLLTVPPGGNATSGLLSFPEAGTLHVSTQPANATANLTITASAPAAGATEKTLRMLSVVLPLLVGVSLLAIAGIVARHGWRHRHNRFFAALYFLSGVKSISEGVTPVSDGFHASAPLFPDALAWQQVGQVCALAMTPLLLLFVASFPRPTAWMQRRPMMGGLAFVPSLGVGLVLFTSTSLVVQFQAAVFYSLLSSVVTAGGLVLLLRARGQSPDKIERQQASYLIAGFLPSFLATWSITLLYLMYGFGSISPEATQLVLDSVIGIFSPLFEILAAGTVAVAILKYHLLGVNPKFRLGVKSGLIGLMFATVFLLTQFIENVVLQGQVFAFAGDYGSFLLSGITGLVLFKPMEVVSTKVSDKLLPDHKDKVAAMSRAAEVYHAQCTYVLRDAQVTEREMAFLRNLRTQLGLSDAEARAIEQEVENLLKVNSPMTGQDAVTTPPPSPPGPPQPPTPPSTP